MRLQAKKKQKKKRMIKTSKLREHHCSSGRWRRKRQVLSAVSKVDRDEADIICSGIEFQSLGPAKANAFRHSRGC